MQHLPLKRFLDSRFSAFAKDLKMDLRIGMIDFFDLIKLLLKFNFGKYPKQELQ